MRPLRRSLAVTCLIVALWGCSTPRTLQGAPPQARGLRLERVVSGLEEPVHVATPPGDPRLFVVEQGGRIRVVSGGRLLAQPFLDLRDRASSGGERGLLSVAFHPRYRENGRFYVNYTDERGDTRVERYTVSADSNRADPASAALVITIRQPFANHNGGLCAFGSDGMLYIGMGDGGDGGDPHGNGQNPKALLGKMLRIDVDRGDPYAIPPDNPFVGRTDTRPEIWATGLRNPWRFCFDPAESLLYIADVGQNRWEEVDVVSSHAAGLNYGWNRLEGRQCYKRDCDTTGTTPPALQYRHDQGCSVTGGEVYRGTRLSGLQGHYFYADYCTGWVRSFRYTGGRVADEREWRLDMHPPVSSFGVDGDGEILIVSHDGTIYRLTPANE